jgi:hypothetical protein
MKEEKTVIFFVDDKAKITKAGKDIPFAELKKGAHVSVKCRRYGDKMVALRIQVLTDSAK